MKVRKRLFFVIASVALLALLLNGAGCASMASLSDYRPGKMYYSGVRLDLEFIADGSVGHGTVGLGFRFLCLVDLPLSFVVDTVLLPVHIAIDLDNP